MAPIVDVAMQLQAEGWRQNSILQTGRIFSNLFLALGSIRKTVVLVFEDIHWADESTLDFVKFLARRISKYPVFHPYLS
jgi:predicted ATPase